MKYFNKTRTQEDKSNQRDLLKILEKNNELLELILEAIKKS